MAAQEKVPTPKEHELAKERLSSCDRPTSATLASPFFRSTFGDLMSCVRQPTSFSIWAIMSIGMLTEGWRSQRALNQQYY